MGVQRLNQFIRDKASAHIHAVDLNSLKGKTIAVDASIYMYKFLGDRCLLAGVYQMVTLFRQAGAELIFVFDGVPPAEKQDVQRERKRKKWEAYDAYQKLQAEITSAGAAATREMHGELANLRRRSLRLTKRDVDSVRSLLSHCGSGQVDAPQEADHICASLVKSGRCWACLSEDTDLFALGCPRVLKGLALQHCTLTLWDWKAARASMGISQDEFRLLCAAAGTDYGPGVGCLDMEGAWSVWTKWKQRDQGKGLAELLAEKPGEMEALTVAAEALRPASSIPPVLPGSRSDSRTRSYLGRFGIVFSSPL